MIGRLAAITLLLVAVAWAATVAAQDISVPTRSYRLDSGQTVRTWLDEGIGVACVMLLDGPRPVGVSCVGLAGTAYNWPVSP
jgi:hypothetical protein